MTKKERTNVAASIRQRLLNRARERGEPFDLILTRYALERLLYRLGRSHHRSDFVVKGATLLQVWTELPNRPTRDLDLLGRGTESINDLATAFREICEEAAGEDDGIEFDPETVRGSEIRENQAYGGVRLTLTARLDGARIPLQIDVGFGDVVTEGPNETEFPSLLGLPPPVLPAYSRESVVSEKFQALVELGIANTRMKDFFDLYVLSGASIFQGPALAEAIRATFRRRGSALPEEVPTGLSDGFAGDRTKRTQWSAFLHKSKLAGAPEDLEAVVVRLREFLLPPSAAVRTGDAFDRVWVPPGPWSSPR